MNPSKVDRSGAYITRYIAKNIVASGLADKCEIQISYAIGVAEPVSILVNCFGTNKIGEEEIEKISTFAKSPNLPRHLYNRKRDFKTGENKHLTGSDLELQKEFDIKRLKKIKSYRGLRHAAGQPVRGQSTRAHFRRNKKRGVGIKKRKPGVENK